MRKVLMSLAAVGLMVSGASATLDNPSKAGGFKGELVRSYTQCAAPNTTGGTLSLPACQPAALEGPGGCTLGGVGKGSISAKVGKGDIALAAKAKGLVGCDGLVLCPYSSVRVTSNNCGAGADCTIVDLVEFQSGIDDGNPATTECCTVAGGACKIKTTINTGGLGAGTLVTGDQATFEIIGAGLKIGGGASVFAAGLFLP